MNSTLASKANTFHALHRSGQLLKLPNIWSPIGARILAAKGYPAIATASAAISANLGYADGERIRRSTLIDQVRRIASSVDLPVTADIEMGFGESIKELVITINQIIECGIVGINIEDSVIEGAPLRPIDDQCARIAAVRGAASAAGIPLFINARIDAFICEAFPSKKSALAEIAVRIPRYLEAGADGIYPIGPSDCETAQHLRDLTDAPLNLLASPKAASPSKLQAIGINRLSFGPYVFRTCLQSFEKTIDSILQSDDYRSIEQALPESAVAAYLRQHPE